MVRTGEDESSDTFNPYDNKRQKVTDQALCADALDGPPTCQYSLVGPLVYYVQVFR